MSKPKQNPDPTSNPEANTPKGSDKGPQNQTDESHGSLKTKGVPDRAPNHNETSRGSEPDTRSAASGRA